MTTRKLIYGVFSILLITLFLLRGVLTAQAAGSDIPLYASGDFTWAKSMGGTATDNGLSIAIDSNGNIYTTGSFQGTADFDPGVGTANLISAGGDDIFISKSDSSGNFIWAKRMGGAGYEYGLGIAVDTNGNVYTVGFFSGIADFDPGVGTANLTSAGSYDIFVSKLDSSGNFVWAKRLGGSGADEGYGIALDSSNNIYTTGSFKLTVDFDPGAGIYNLTSAGNYDIFVSKLDSSGNFVWAKSMGGVGYDEGKGIDVDSSGIYTTGDFEGTADFDPDASTVNMTSGGDFDVFVSKLSSNGTFVWAKNMGGTSGDASLGYSIAIDSSGNVYTAGAFVGIADFDPGAGISNLASVGSWDIFISKLNSNGNFVWAKSMGGTNVESGYGVVADSSGNVYATGNFQGTVDFDPGAGTFDLASAGGYDTFISKLDNSGNFLWAKRIGGTQDDNGYGIAIDSNGNVYTTGNFQGTVDFDPGAGTYNLISAGGDDIFISKLLKDNVFGDVPDTYWAMSFVERLYAAGITGGCSLSPLQYCPDSTVTRAQMAVFLLRGIHSSSYNPPAVGASTGFGDVPFDYWSGSWIKQLAAEGITGGCGSGNYCPEHPVTRDQMAVFLLRSKYGSSYTPPGVGASTGFGDVPIDHWAAPWIKQLVTEGITAGCGNGNYCPELPVTRAQMAVFLVRTFNLP